MAAWLFTAVVASEAVMMLLISEASHRRVKDVIHVPVSAQIEIFSDWTRHARRLAVLERSRRVVFPNASLCVSLRHLGQLIVPKLKVQTAIRLRHWTVEADPK